MPLYLTKTDFKACLHCRTKLHYRKNRYPSNLDENEYMRFLADGGFMVEFIAKARFPGGVDLVEERNPVVASAKTKELLASGEVTLFEAAAISGRLHVRTDILRREGNVLHLIEVKSSSVGEDENFSNDKGVIKSKWWPYIMDVAFQTHVLRAAFPGFVVKPQLCVIDKSKPVSVAETVDLFLLDNNFGDTKSRPTVRYHGDIALLAASKVVCFRSVETEVDLVMPAVLQRIDELLALYDGEKVERVQEDLGELYSECRACEYRFQSGHSSEKNGFDECWGPLAHTTPHILDLYKVGGVKAVPGLLARNRASLLDLERSDLGIEGKPQQERRLMQWDSLKNDGAEHLPMALRRELEAHQEEPGWPLHFLDFEACNIALPHHAGLRPYERVAFQWSCHTLHADGTLTHAEWINIHRDLPNFKFAASLRDHLGEAGTVYVWSPYEQSTLRVVMEQIDAWMQLDLAEALRLAGGVNQAELTALAAWIDRLLGPEDEDGKRHSGRIRDLHALAMQYYFHPRMGGRTSIKVVLPAVWETNDKLWRNPAFAKYFQRDAGGKVMDPYKTLQSLDLGNEEEAAEVVQEGTAAIRVYQDLIFSNPSSLAVVKRRRQLLLQYCELDTAAMVMIWMHWIGR